MNHMNEAIPPTEPTPVILGRPAWGKVAFGLRELTQRRGEILALATDLEKEGGGLLALSHSEAQESTVLLLVSLLMGTLKSERKSVQLSRPMLEPFLSEKEKIGSDGYLLVHNLPQMSGLIELLESDRKPSGRVVIATGLREEWEQLRITLPCVFYVLPKGTEDTAAEFEALVQTELAGYRKLGPDAKAYFLAALFDAWGIPLPFTLLARTLGRDEDEVGILVEEAQEQQLLFWIELEKPPALLVSTKAPAVARTMVGRLLSEAEILQGYADVIRAMDHGKKEERYTLIKLFQALLRGGSRWARSQWGIQQSRRQWLQRLIQTHGAAIEPLWRQEDAVEILLWGKIFAELRLFAHSERIFCWGLEHEPRNVFLLHARAKMLGEWEQTSGAKYTDARKAFEDVARVAPDNPYVWQAWGVMEAERRNARDARDRFGRALHAARRTSEKVYTWVAWADLEMGEGHYAKAAALLEQARELAPRNLHVLHSRGKHAFYQGRYQEADTHLHEVLRFDPVNVPAFNTLGDMAAKRGHWRQAAQYLQQALRIDPDNIPTVHALGEVRAEQGMFAVTQGNTQEILECFQEAQKHFQQVLGFEEHNPRALVASSVLLRKWAAWDREQGRGEAAAQKFQDAEARITILLERDRHNTFALHALGELQRQQGALQEAERLFQEILRQDRCNLPALLSLADLRIALKQGDEALRLLRQVEQLVQIVQKGERLALPLHELIQTYNAWAKVALEAGHAEKAVELVRDSALGADAENAYTHQTYTAILERLGRLEEARLHREKAYALAVALTP